MGKRILLVTFVLVALYLLFRNAEPYKQATAGITETFSRMWLALTAGK